MIDITNIAMMVIGVASVVMCVFLIPLLREKLGNERFNSMLQDINVAVNAFQAIGKNHGYDGETKNKLVKEWLANHGYVINDDICVYIEDAYNKMKNAIGAKNE